MLRYENHTLGKYACLHISLQFGEHVGTRTPDSPLLGLCKRIKWSTVKFVLTGVFLKFTPAGSKRFRIAVAGHGTIAVWYCVKTQYSTWVSVSLLGLAVGFPLGAFSISVGKLRSLTADAVTCSLIRDRNDKWRQERDQEKQIRSD